MNSHKIMALNYLDIVQKCFSLYKCAKIAECFFFLKVCLIQRVS